PETVGWIAVLNSGLFFTSHLSPGQPQTAGVGETGNDGVATSALHAVSQLAGDHLRHDPAVLLEERPDPFRVHGVDDRLHVGMEVLVPLAEWGSPFAAGGGRGGQLAHAGQGQLLAVHVDAPAAAHGLASFRAPYR